MPITIDIGASMKKPLKLILDHPVVSVISLVASCIAICAFLTGVQSIPQLLFKLLETPIPTPTRAPTPSFEAESLITGTEELEFQGIPPTIGIIFKFGQATLNDDPADLFIKNCDTSGDEIAHVMLHCNLHGANIWKANTKYLYEIKAFPLSGVNVLVNELMDHSCYAMQSLDGHPAKFCIGWTRMSNTLDLEIQRITIRVTYAYQTNDRDDFLNP